jgi:hypothetical protein
MNRTTLLAIAVLGAIAAGPIAAHAQTPEYPTLTRDEELRLAISAGPLTVSQHADVYLMSTQGFTRAIEGTNGWACIVVRAAGDKRQLAPHCLNPQAVKSVLPAFLREGALQAKGMSKDAIDAEITRQFASGELTLPSGPAYAYMLSEGQRVGRDAGNFKPHFMLYIPYVTNADIGGDPAQMQFPFVGPFENHPLATVVILMPQFVSPKDVVLPRR